MIWIAAALCLCAFGYLGYALLSVLAFSARLRRPVAVAPAPAVTLLKPLCGDEPELLRNLRSCCRQDYSTFQIVFGVSDPNDAAATVARQVIDEHPHLDLTLVVSGEPTGPNLKVSCLARMQHEAKHGIICVADSDMRVQPNYLSRTMAPFADPEVGAVTCLYKAAATGGLASRLGAMFVNDWFLPSALVSARLRPLRYCFGATMALRRHALETMGGFEALVDYLADDYLLGQRVCKQGYRIALANCVVENLVHEPHLGALLRHELRWARTMRRVEPLGYGLAALTDAVPVAILAAVVMYSSGAAAWAASSVVGLALAARAALHLSVVRVLAIRHGSSAWLIPVRDVLTAALRIWSFIPGPVLWRGREFDVDCRGRLLPRSSGRTTSC